MFVGKKHLLKEWRAQVSGMNPFYLQRDIELSLYTKSQGWRLMIFPI